MKAEAPFNAEIAIKKWQRKFERRVQVNLFRLGNDILRIHLGENWQNPHGVDLFFGPKSIIHLNYIPAECIYFKNTEGILMRAQYADSTVEELHFHHQVSPRGRERFNIFAWDPSRYFRFTGGTELIRECFRKVNPDPYQVIEIGTRLWDASQATLDLNTTGGLKGIIALPILPTPVLFPKAQN